MVKEMTHEFALLLGTRSYTYHKTYEVEAKVHASLLLDTLNFLLFAIYHFYRRFMNIHESKSDMLCK